MNSVRLAAVAAALLVIGGLSGALLQAQSVRAASPTYKVVHTPVNSGAPQSAAQLEKFLNDQSAEGWRLQSDIDAKLFIFERRP